MHIIEQNVALGFIEVIVEGFWDEEHFEGFAADLQRAIATFPGTASGRPTMTLYNYTRAAIQPQTVVAKMRALAQHPAMRGRRVAMYTDGILARQQARRVAEGRDNMRVFDCRADALAFLLDDETPVMPQETVAAHGAGELERRLAVSADQRPGCGFGSSGAFSA